MENNNYGNENETRQNSDNFTPRQNSENDLVKKNRMWTYGLIAAGVLLLIGGIIFFTTGKETEKVATESQTNINQTVKTSVDSVKTDTAKAVAGPAEVDEYEEGEYEGYSENYVIANEALIRTAPSETAAATSNKLKFGDRVFIDNSYDGTGKYSKVYFSDPSKNKSQTPYYVASYILTYQGEFEDYRKYFSLKPFAGLATKTKKLIMDNDYANSRNYELTQNLERSKSAICYRDFDNDGIQDVAVILDNNEDQYSRLLVICTNAATNDPYLAFAENYSDKMRINSFKKGAGIFMNSSTLVKSPADGVILNASDTKIAIVYDKPNQKFNSYYQSASDNEYE